ncbi:MAG: ATP synthase subunit I [Gammaproteobacteria bacterium]
MADRRWPAVSKILIYQALITVMTASGFAAFDGGLMAVSAAFGGVAAFIPNLYFALMMHRASGQEARKFVRAFYAGETGKLLITAALFTLIFQIPNIEILPLLAGYLAALSVFWFALLMR